MRIDTVLQVGTDILNQASDSARLDTEIILAHCLKKGRSHLYTWPEALLTNEQSTDFEAAIDKRKTGFPVAYITGYQEFWSLKLKVTPEVLIPRADTELLVETALEKIKDIPKPSILELGTGSGAISLALASERPDSQITATDISQAAIVVADENRQSLQIENVTFLESDWFTNINAEKFDLIVSNPPYINPHDKHLGQDIRHEPIGALVSNDNGLADLTHIIHHAPNFLKDNAWLMLEHGYDQGRAVSELLKAATYEQVSCLKDLSDNDRVNLGLKPN